MSPVCVLFFIFISAYPSIYYVHIPPEIFYCTLNGKALHFHNIFEYEAIYYDLYSVLVQYQIHKIIILLLSCIWTIWRAYFVVCVFFFFVFIIPFYFLNIALLQRFTDQLMCSGANGKHFN